MEGRVPPRPLAAGKPKWPISNAVNIAELAIEKGAGTLLIPVTARRQLYDLSDDMATKIDVQFYQDARDALLKTIVE